MNQKIYSILTITIFVLIIVYIVGAILLPVSGLNPTNAKIDSPILNINSITWPASDKQAAIGALNYGVFSTNGEQKSAPIASIAKTILALSIVKEKPIKLGEQGPLITITENDINLYKSYLAQNGSVVPIKLNDQLSEYQLLQALLLPSGDNIADTLAIWAFGSVDNYLDYANKFVADLGLTQTHLADSSGLSAQTVSSAEDLITIGEMVINDPVLAEIVNQPTVNLPLVGEVKNYNTLLGTDGVIGIKTGNTDEAGGCLLFAQKKSIDNHDVILVGAILGSESRAKVLNDTKNFLASNANSYKFINVINAGQVIGEYSTPWGKKVNIVAKDDLTILAINKENVTIESTLDKIKIPAEKGKVVGTISVKAGSKTYSIPAILENQISNPSIFWKLINPKKLLSK
jgi:D-alanyl-D-alanine carboxypeptidase (penicillin-binding protein 5/6)